MIRNAVDHGIESPGDRERTGKPVNGIVQLSAYHSAGNVVVEIRDDGRGLDREAILSKALERGLITTIDGLSDEEVYGLIFQPGFSTASTVSEVSGRGVGMDVVKTNIESLRGQVEVKSWPGQGSVVKMSLPLTLAIIDGMVIRVGTQKFVIPTVSIVRSVQPVETDLSRVFQRGEMLSLQGKLIPLFRLATLFEIEDAATDPTQAIVVVVEDDRRQTGLLVDELIGSQQIVIKTLGEALGDIPGVSGSAIMPNGRVGLILDVGGLVRLASDFNPEKQAPDEFSQSDVSGADRETV
jgi:two-component system chemotaxis sensor kinase CheA